MSEGGHLQPGQRRTRPAYPSQSASPLADPGRGRCSVLGRPSDTAVVRNCPQEQGCGGRVGEWAHPAGDGSASGSTTPADELDAPRRRFLADGIEVRVTHASSPGALG